MLAGANGFARRSALLIVIGFLAGHCSAAEHLRYTGVNLAGAEFNAEILPGIFGNDYTYPTELEVDYFVGKGINIFRLPFRWERLQPKLNGPFDQDELARIQSFVELATSRGADVILDPHNFGRYYPDPNDMESDPKRAIGGPAVPIAAFADLWSKLAEPFKENPRVLFSLMNEPNEMPTEQWVRAANAAIAAIRKTGAKNPIIVCGNGYTGAFNWNADWYGTPNAQAMLSIVDPADNVIFEVHQYLDEKGSGRTPEIYQDNPNIGAERLAVFTDWLKKHKKRGFLGEFGVANERIGPARDQIGDETLAKMLSHLEANRDVWLGWTWWSGGPWWDGSISRPNNPPYMFLLNPDYIGTEFQRDKPAMGALAPFLAGRKRDAE